LVVYEAVIETIHHTKKITTGQNTDATTIHGFYFKTLSNLTYYI